MQVRVKDTGPGVLVVSPPNRLIPNSAWSTANPVANAANHLSGVPRGAETVSR